VKATEISNEFASSAVMAQRKQLHLLRFRWVNEGYYAILSLVSLLKKGHD
jgi:hypothetical protein